MRHEAGHPAPRTAGTALGGSVPGRVLVCIPTYEERENLPDTLTRLRAAVPEADVLVIDDASPDGTGEIADRLAATDPSVHVLHRAGKAGLGAAYVAGFAWGLGRGYDVLVEMDADGSHLPEELPRLLAALHGADVVLGSRWMPGGEVRNWPRSRLALSRGGNIYVRTALDMPLSDATGGFRAYRASVLRSLALDSVASQGYCFQVDVVWQAWRGGWRVVEVPITFIERERGQSKMSRDIVAEALWRVTWWGIRSRRSRVRLPPRTDSSAGLPDFTPVAGHSAATATMPLASGERRAAPPLDRPAAAQLDRPAAAQLDRPAAAPLDRPADAVRTSGH
ncbi:MAG: apolipoprotein N-acyltransferase [Frankiaceae bacterium]|nr:apolipoprotein N-acyltransferase [Frankiaceae bacterium]